MIDHVGIYGSRVAEGLSAFNVLYYGVAPNRRQAIIWTNADLIHWHIYAALGWDELICYHGYWNKLEEIYYFKSAKPKNVMLH